MKLPIIRRMRRKQGPSIAKIGNCKHIPVFNKTAMRFILQEMRSEASGGKCFGRHFG